MIVRVLSSPLLHLVLATIAGGLHSKAPLPEYWLAWAAAVAMVESGVAGILMNPQHLMSVLMAKTPSA